MDGSAMPRRLRAVARITALRVVAMGALGAVIASTAHAQDGGKGFLFGRPDASLVIRGGLAMPSAGSDIFSFATSNLTLGKRDFNAPSIGLDVQMHMSDRVDITLGIDYAGSNAKSEFRDWVDNKGQPIEQFTGLQRTPVMLGLKYYLAPAGRTIGRLAWVPRKFVPYVGAGVGFTWYEYHQDGDFIDLSTTKVFHDSYKSQGWTPSTALFGGFEYSLSPKYALSTELRYTTGSATLGSDFSGFKPIDLSGVATNIGVHVRF